MTWTLDAACRGEDLDQFFPEEPVDMAHVRFTKRICRSCPVRDACLAEALATPYKDDWGIRGGLLRGERFTLRRQAA